jgi:hypothetical protein
MIEISPEAFTEKDIEGEWYPLEAGSYNGFYVKHFHKINVVLFGKVQDDRMIPIGYCEGNTEVH